MDITKSMLHGRSLFILTHGEAVEYDDYGLQASRHGPGSTIGVDVGLGIRKEYSRTVRAHIQCKGYWLIHDHLRAVVGESILRDIRRNYHRNKIATEIPGLNASPVTWDFFISHSQANRADQCAMLSSDLERRGYRVCYDNNVA